VLKMDLLGGASTMGKSWEQYKKEYLESVLEEANNRIYVSELCESPIEKIVNLELYKLYEYFPVDECKVHPQVIIGKYVVDFLITYEIPNTSKELMIVVECDGHEFHEKTREQVARDKERDRFMTLEGYTILRYSGREICEDPFSVVRDVQHLICKFRGY
jgi:very-short-patch-repair endonuclease